MKVKTITSILFLVLILYSCANLNDEWIDLGDDYVCKIDGGTKAIYSNQIYYNTEIHSKIVDYKFDEKYIIAKQEPDYDYYKNFVESNYSTRYARYEYYIVRNQDIPEFKDIRTWIVADSLHYKLLKSKGVTIENQIEDIEKIKTILDSVFHYDPFYKKVFSSKENYWIIDKDKNIRFGPFSKKEFEKELKQKNINLKL